MHRSRFLVACAASGAVILWAPFIGEIRRWIRTQFPGDFVLIVGSAIGLLIGGALLAALLRIRDRRALRYGALATAVSLGLGYSRLFADGRAEVDVVERFHFVEFGVITLLFYRASRPLNDVSMFVLPVVAGLLVGTLEEWFQWFIPVRVGEMRDIFLNGAAIASGLLFSVAVDPPSSFSVPLRPGSGRRIARAVGVVVLAIAAFFSSVHLGYEVHDEEIGTFRSRYSARRLAELSAERARQWRAHPPPLTVPRLSREDQYMTEGVEHVMERNELWERGDIAGAWLENRILEKYYAPVLVTPSYHSKTGHQWAEEQRANARTAAGARGLSGGGYVSKSNPAPIYATPQLLYWAVVLAVAAALFGGSAFLGRRARDGKPLYT